MTTIDIHSAGIEMQDKNSWHLGMLRTQAHSAIAARVLVELADRDERICVLTADLGFSNRTVEFSYRHPERFFNLGIAEQNMVSVAAGLEKPRAVGYLRRRNGCIFSRTTRPRSELSVQRLHAQT